MSTLKTANVQSPDLNSPSIVINGTTGVVTMPFNASPAPYVVLATGNLTGSAFITISSVSQDYNALKIVVKNAVGASNSGGVFRMRLGNGGPSTTANWWRGDGSTAGSSNQTNPFGVSAGDETNPVVAIAEIQNYADDDFDTNYNRNRPGYYYMSSGYQNYIEQQINTEVGSVYLSSQLSYIELSYSSFVQFTGGTYTVYGVNLP